MTSWRMAFRAGKNGPTLWPWCKRRGVAVIQYWPVDDVDLSRPSTAQSDAAWAQLAPSQRTSLRHFLAMEVGDVIFVKEGPTIVGRGVVSGPYCFVKNNRVEDLGGAVWQHQRQVVWEPLCPTVEVQIGRPASATVGPLDGSDIRRVKEATAEELFAEASDIEGTVTETRVLVPKRSRRLRNLVFRAAKGICGVCDRDFSKVLSGRGTRVLQVHHRKQLSASEMPVRTTARDLVVVCANCHLLLHLDPLTALSVEQLRELLIEDAQSPASSHQLLANQGHTSTTN